MADIKQMQINGQLYEVPGNGDVSKGYVDQRDTQVLADAKAYADGKASEAQSAAITHADNQDAQTLAAAKAYTDEHSSSYVLPAATRTELGGIKAAPAQAGDTKGVYIGDDQMLHVTPDVLVVQATKEGGSWVADVGSETIRSFGGNAIIKAEVEGVQYVYQYQRYDSARGAVFDQANLQPDAIERIEVIVDRSRNITIVRTPYTPPVQSTTAVCHDEAAPQSVAANTWYVSKDLPKPTATVGLMVDVYWEHGRVDDLGYDVKLVWGAPGDPDNELILDQTNTSDHLHGEYSIPVEGTVRYQLVEANGRKHWQYVSGKLLPRQFSSATEAATADKVVPGMQLSYIPGEEIFVQLDNGNTAAVARIVPDEGPTLPIYGNGEGAATGEIPAGYILQLKNAGDHWQILNSPGKGGAGQTAVLYTPNQGLNEEQKKQARENIGLNIAPATSDDTQEVHRGEDGKLYTKPSGGKPPKPDNYELVGETPFAVPGDGYLVVPKETTRLYTQGGVENLAPKYTSVETATPDVVYEIDGNQISITEGTLQKPTQPMVTLVDVPVEPGAEYSVYQESSSGGAWVAFYVGAGYKGIKDKSWLSFTIPGEQAKLNINVCNFKQTFPLITKIWLLKGKYTSLPPEGQTIEIVAQANSITNLNPFAGQTVYSDPTPIDVFQYKEETGGRGGSLVCFGDSLTQMSKYPEKLSEMGMSATNLGVSGSQLCGVSTYSMTHVVDAVKAGDMTEQINAGDNPNYKSLLALLASCDGIVLEYGTNDYNQSRAFSGEGKDTIEGGLRYVLTELFKLYPAKMIYVISTFPQTWWVHDPQPVNPNGTVRQMNEVIHNVCKEFGVPWLNMLDNYCNNEFTKMAISQDGLHPNNDAGMERYSKMIFGMLKALGR